MKRHLKRLGVLLLGWGFILVGFVGLFLPVLQGVLFLLIGLFILSTEYAWAHHLLQKIKTRFPRIATHFDRARERAERWLHRCRRSENASRG